jgi:hypothetical protein
VIRAAARGIAGADTERAPHIGRAGRYRAGIWRLGEPTGLRNPAEMDEGISCYEERGRPGWLVEVAHISPLNLTATGRVYGVQRVCTAWAFRRALIRTHRTVQRTPPFRPKPFLPINGGWRHRSIPRPSHVYLLGRGRVRLSSAKGLARSLAGCAAWVATAGAATISHARCESTGYLCRAVQAPARARESQITIDAPDAHWASDGAKRWAVDDG